MNTAELLDQEKFKLSEIEREIAAHDEQGEGLDKYLAQLQAELKKLNEETGPAWRAKAVELHEAKQQAIGAIRAYESLTEQAASAAA